MGGQLSMTAPRQTMRSPPAEQWSRHRGQWCCPACGKLFARLGQGHSCAVVPLDHHFEDRPRARELFDAFRSAIEQTCGPVRLSVAKTRIGLITRITFAVVMPRKSYLRAHILLPRKVDSPRFLRVDDGPPHWVHHFEIRDESDLDEELRALLREAYQVGSHEP